MTLEKRLQAIADCGYLVLESSVLRYVSFGEGYEMVTWDTGVLVEDHHQVGYALFIPDSETPMFCAEDYECPWENFPED